MPQRKRLRTPAPKNVSSMTFTMRYVSQDDEAWNTEKDGLAVEAMRWAAVAVQPCV